MPNIAEWRMVQEIKGMLGSVLKNIPVLSDIAAQESSPAPSDIEISARMEGGGLIKFFCEVKGKGEPQYIRKGIAQLWAGEKLQDEATAVQYYNMIGAPYISPAAAKLCEEWG